MVDPYRKRGEPATVPRELRRWFTKSSDVEKGPFEARVVRRSFKDGYIKATTLVRAEDETEWRELASVSELRVKVNPPTRAPTSSQLDPTPVVERGTFWGGFVAALFVGLLALIVVYATPTRPETRRGAYTGFILRIGLAVVYVVLTAVVSRT